MLPIVVWGAVAHNYGTALLQQSSSTLYGECAPDDACIQNRECAFGTTKNYEIARNDLFEVTGYPLSCENQCECVASPHNEVKTEYNKANSTGHWYNISLCLHYPALKAAMSFHTSGYDCENVFREAQSQFIRLCGMQNGLSCEGKCTELYQIDTPVPLCEQTKDLSDSTMYAIFGYILLGCTLWTWTAGIDINEYTTNTLSQRFRPTRYTRKHSKDDSEFDALLSSFF